MKKVLTVLICILSVFCVNVNAAKKTKKTTAKKTLPAVVEGKAPVNVYIFTREACGYCIAAENYLTELEKTYGDYFDMVVYEMYDANWKVTNKKYLELETRVAKLFNTEVNGTPYIVIGDSYNINGWDANSTGDEIKATILKEYVNENYKDIVAETLAQIESEPDPHANDGIIVAGIGIVIIAAVGVIIYFGRKNK